MQIFKCKMCGGALNVELGASVLECEFCGTKQTVPKLDSERKASLYDRANHFLRNNEYDKAAGIYEIILNEDKTDAEAYWSALLCRYGVEYVEDPNTRKMVPTVNRTQYTSILNDEDYKTALKYADGYQRDIYQEQAQEIDRIQQSILDISGKEQPFDVFICYKESDSNGRRTVDSVLAQDIYNNLKQEGFKVFFSRITLEDKLGIAYEPYIFAALNSAKVMIAVGTKKEHFESVWVKNEWSRYLSLINAGKKKTLIPAYKGMDAYDLPQEFLHLQAQDMSKLGFMQDLVHGVKKIIGGQPPKQTVKETVVVDGVKDTVPLIRRAYLFLEEKDFTSAKKYAEKVLDTNPEHAEAYFIELLVEMQEPSAESLIANAEEELSEYLNYQRAMRFADAKYKETLVGYNKKIVERLETEEKERIYQVACTKLEKQMFFDAGNTFAQILDYKDSATMLAKCQNLVELSRKENIYRSALSRISSVVNEKDYKQSIADLQSISGYKDADEKVCTLQARLEKYYYDKKQAEEQAKIRAEEERLRRLREEELRRIKAEKLKQKAKKTAKIGVPSILALALVLVLTFTVFVPIGKYSKAKKLVKSGNLAEAIKIYEDLGDYKQSEQMIETLNAVQKIKNENIENGIRNVLNLGVPVTVTYNCGGGNLIDGYSQGQNSVTTYSSQTDAKTYTYNNIKDFKGLKKPERSGYKFSGWSVSLCSVSIDKEVTGVSLRLIAKWDVLKYEITYDLQGGSFFVDNPIEYDGYETFTVYNPTRTGYTFIGWTGTGLQEKTMSLTIELGSSGNRSYTANWQANTYVVKYDANGGVMTGTIAVATYDKEFKFAKVERSGYKFLGWYDGNIKYQDFDNWELLNGLNLKAKWEIISYNVEYNLNGGSATNPTTYNVDTNTFTLNNPTRTGYEFIGWTGTGLTDYTMTVTIEKGSVGNREYVANWQANLNTVIFNANGGVGEMLPQNIYVGDTAKLNVNTFTRSGYIFNGWATSPSGGVVYNDCADYTMGVNSTYNLYAVWGGTVGLTYTLDNGAYTVTGYNGSESDVYISATYLGKPVTSIGEESFSRCSSLTSVTIGNSVTSIGDCAFLACSSLTSIEIPNSVTSIGDWAFSDSSLRSIEIPNSVTSIGDRVFYNCNLLTSVVIGDSVTSIGSWAFSHCRNLISVTIGNSVTSIGNYAFNYCDSLTSIEIPNSVTSIGNYAFSNCSSLTSVIVPDSVTSIGSWAFNNCSSLTSIIFEDTTTWYRTKSETDWYNKTGGWQTSVTADNATNFKSAYANYYWYKI